MIFAFSPTIVLEWSIDGAARNAGIASALKRTTTSHCPSLIPLNNLLPSTTGDMRPSPELVVWNIAFRILPGEFGRCDNQLLMAMQKIFVGRRSLRCFEVNHIPLFWRKARRFR